MEHPGNLTLLVSRPKDSDLVVKTAKFPSLAMTQESKYDVWLYPHGDDRACKRLVDCANKYLHGDEEESNEHFEKRMALQKFCSGREHTAMPKPTEISFDRNKLTAEQLAELETIEAGCSPDQRAVLDKIYSCQSAVHVVQGPPGTGKTSFAAARLVPILNIFGLKANCYAPSNAATDVFARSIPKELKPVRYHGLGRERLGISNFGEVNNGNPVPIPDEGISEDEVVWISVLTAATMSQSWLTPGKMNRPNFHLNALHIRAFQRAGIMDEELVLSRSLPATVPAKYLKWARYFYKLGMDKDDFKDEEHVSKFRDLTMELFHHTLDAANFVVTTCSNAADETLRKHTAPHVVIVDEAAVSKELETIMSMYHNLGSASLFITLGDHKQLPPTVPSLHMKLERDDDGSPPYNIFAPQLNTSLMARLLDSGMDYSMLKEQFRMTGGIQDLSSRLCYMGRLQNANCTLLANRPKSRTAIAFLKAKFNLVTDVPHLCMNVQSGVCLNSLTKSRKNMPNVIIDMYIVESVVEAGTFKPNEITIITPYKAQASAIRHALSKASNTEFWRNRDVNDIKVHTIDSMQGSESPMVITDFVMAQKRTGKFGFVTNKGRINVSMSRAKFFQVFVGDLAAADPIKEKDPAADDEKKDDVQEEDANDKTDEDDDEELAEKPSRETIEKPIKMLFDYYKTSGVVINTIHTDKAQKEYVDLTETDAWLAAVPGKKIVTCRKCEKPGHIAKDCPTPNALVKCHRCSEVGHRATDCHLPKPVYCFQCQKEGHKTSWCPGLYTLKEYQLVDRAAD